MTRKDALLQAAKDLFGEYGFSETTFKKIADRAGVALGLLTHHYGNKEKLFMAAGLDVLDNFLRYLQAEASRAKSGKEGVMAFCRAYLDYSVDPRSNWLVLVRCSPYSDMKVHEDREVMFRKFAEVHSVLEAQLQRGMNDGSLPTLSVAATAQVVVSLMVGANRTRVLTPYAYTVPHLYEETLRFVEKALAFPDRQN